MTNSLNDLKTELKKLANPDIAAHSSRFFKSGKGEYGEGDKFLGIRVPQTRSVVKKYKSLALADCLKLLQSKYHEERLCAVLLLVQMFTKADESLQKKIYKAYLANTQFINNWDIVDSSAHQIVGAYLVQRKRNILKMLAKSSSLWERRIAIIATLHFIRLKDFDDTLTISRILLKDKEDLIHKAVGWMLREVGNRNLKTETDFLDQHYQTMPRTMLRYAIEKFTEKQRKQYLQGV